MKKLTRIVVAIMLLITFTGCNKSASNSVKNLEDSYRTIVVASCSGEVTIAHNGESNLVNAYEGMSLLDGDTVTVGDKSNLTLDVDSDKHLFVEPNTKFCLVAEGDEDSNRTKIKLETGSVLCQIQEKLKDDESFDIETASSTMSVRGTVFRVSLMESTDNNNYEMVEVYNGKVWSNIVNSENEVTLEPGQCALIKEDKDGANAAFVTDDQIDEAFWNSSDTNMKVTKDEGTGSPVLSIAYNKLSSNVLSNLNTISESGQELSVTTEEITKLETTKKVEEYQAEVGVTNAGEYRAGYANDDICAERGHTIIKINGVEQCIICGKQFSSEYQKTEKDKAATEKAKEEGLDFPEIILPESYHGEIETDVPTKDSNPEDEEISIPVYSQDDSLNSEVEE